MKTLIQGGTVVTATETVTADVLVDGERVAAIGTGMIVEPDRTIDATGRYVMPGAVDVHTHMDLPFGGSFCSDDFASGTRAAAFGGTTTIVDFALQDYGESLRTGLDRWHEKAQKSHIDFGFHMIVREVNDQVLKEMDTLVGEGVTSFKLFMAYPGVFMLDDAAIFQAMQRAADSGALIMMHAENGGPIDVLIRQYLQQGKTDPVNHSLTRPPVMEGEAVHRVFKMAELAGAPAYIVHLSSRDALDALRDARDRGVAAYAETCPQYLYLSIDDMARPGFEGAKFVCSPPLRTADHQDELWKGLVADDLQIVSTDHAPFNFRGQKDLGKDDFSKIPNGLPSVEDRFTLLYQGVVDGRIGLNRFVEIVATAPAKMFGLSPRKGTIAPGSDADIVIFDPEHERTISAETHHMNVDYSCYEGRRVKGLPEIVMQRGNILVEDGAFHAKEGQGILLAEEPDLGVTVDVERLRRLPLFGELDHHDLSMITHHVGEIEASEGQVLFEQGSIPYEMFVIEEGTAEVTKDDETVGTIGPGDVVGEIALLRFQRRMGTVRVTSPLRAVTVSADNLQLIEEEMPEIAGHLRSIMAAREREIAEMRTEIQD